MATALQTTPVNSWNPAYGGVPSVPDPTSTASASIAGNLANLSKIGQLGTGVTGQNVTNSMAPLTSALPGLTGDLGAQMGNISSMIGGQIPADVLTQLQQQSAERGVSSGLAPGSPNSNAAYLKSLGLTSLGLEQTGQSDLTSLMGSIPQPGVFNPQSMMTTPQQQQQAQEAASVLGASPIPAAAAGTNMSALMSALSMGKGTMSGMTGGTTGGPTGNPYTVLSSGQPDNGLGFAMSGTNASDPVQIVNQAIQQGSQQPADLAGVEVPSNDNYDVAAYDYNLDEEYY
jgi:hypothetical protein